MVWPNRVNLVRRLKGALPNNDFTDRYLPGDPDKRYAIWRYLRLEEFGKDGFNVDRLIEKIAESFRNLLKNPD